MILLYIHPSVEKQDIIVNNAKVEYKTTTEVDINDLQQYDRIGFLYHQPGYFPFVLNGETSQPNVDYFSNNWIHLLATMDVTIDLITCDYSTDLQDILSNYTLKSVIHYSTDATGNTPIGDWILEKTINDETVNVNVKDLYFEDGIENWDVYLGSTSNHSMVLDQYGNVYSFGNNSDGQLGLGTSGTDMSSPQLINDISNIKAISAGPYHSLVLDKNGRVYSFGNNDSGQLGLGTSGTDMSSAQLIEAVSNIKAISAGAVHSLVLDKNGRVYSFGNDDNGQLGLGLNYFTRTYKSSPQLINDISNIKAISAGAVHSLVLDKNGRVYSFGGNYYKQLGLGTIGSVTDMSSAQLIVEISNINIKAISAGGKHSLVLDNDGKVYSFGNNSDGQLGLGTSGTDMSSPQLINDISNIKAISAGAVHSLVLDKNGRVYSFGDNIDGQLGLGTSGTDMNSAQLIKGSIRDKKIIGLMDDSSHSTTIQLELPKNVIQILENNIGQLRLLRSTYIELYNPKFKYIFNTLPKSNVLRIYANDNAFCYIRKDNRNAKYEYLYVFGDYYSGGTLPDTIKSNQNNQSDKISYLFIEKGFQSSYKIVHTKYAFALLNNNILYLWGHPLYGGNYRGLNRIENCSNVFANDYAFLVVMDNNPTSPVLTTGHPLYGGDMFQLQALFSNTNSNIQYTIQNVYHTKTSFTLRLLDTNDKNHYITLGVHNTDIIE